MKRWREGLGLDMTVWPHKPGVRLFAGQAKWEVPDGEPDVITRMEHGHRTVVAIRLLLLATDGMPEPHMSTTPNLFCAP